MVQYAPNAVFVAKKCRRRMQSLLGSVGHASPMLGTFRQLSALSGFAYNCLKHLKAVRSACNSLK
eukprot:307020-Alexandrium_andersonii.AAC.1